METNTKEYNTFEAYHDYYRSRSVKNGLSHRQLIKDDLEQVFYPIKPGICNIARKAIFEVMDSYSCVVPNDSERYESVMNSILTPSDDKSCIVLFNHDNFATMTVFINELYKHAHKFPQNNNHQKPISLKDNLHIVVWPAVTTQTQVRSLQAIINIIKTVPSRDNIPGMEEKFKTMKSNFIKQLLTITQKPNQIILMAPTGTRDILNWNLDGTIKSIMFKNDEGIGQTARLVKSFVENWNKIVLVGTNGTWLKRPGAKDLKHSDNNWTAADIYIDIKEVKTQECLDLIQQKNLMPTVAWLVKDHEGNSIGKVIPPKVFDAYKKKSQQPEIKSDEHQNYYFKDSLRKQCVRKIFTLLK